MSVSMSFAMAMIMLAVAFARPTLGTVVIALENATNALAILGTSSGQIVKTVAAWRDSKVDTFVSTLIADSQDLAHICESMFSSSISPRTKISRGA